MAVYDLISSDQTNLSNQDPEWVLFIEDHRRFLVQESDLVILSSDEVNIYDYRPEDFLRDRSYPASVLWIFLWINQISSPEKYVDKSKVYLPSLTQIQNLRYEYESFKAELDK